MSFHRLIKVLYLKDIFIFTVAPRVSSIGKTCAHSLGLGEVTGLSLESSRVRPSARMAGGLPPLPSTNVGKYCWVSHGSLHLKKK